MPSEPIRPLPRRTLLAVSGTAVLAAAAACSSGGTAAGTSAATSAAGSGSTPARTSSSSATASSSGSGAGSSAGSPTATEPPAPPTAAAGPSEAPPGGTPVASVADVQAAGSLVVGENEDAYLLAYAGDTVVAHTAVCTHQRCTVGASGLCPCHQSRFDVATGAVINGPALRPLAERAVTVSGGQVYLA